MTLNRFVLTTAFVAAASLASTVSAQERDAKKREAARSQQEQTTKGEAHAEKRQAGENGKNRETQPQRAEPQRAEPRRAEPQRAEPQRAEPQRAEPRRDYNYSAPAAPRAEPRRDDLRRGEAIRNEKKNEAVRREYQRDAAGRYYYNHDHYAYAPHVYYRPYVFRPHLTIGFGLFTGYPVPYMYSYPAPIVVYGYRAPRTPVYVAPGSTLYGGVSLEIGPYDADVFVDGGYAGHVEDFDGTRQPLTLVAGVHHIEVQAPGFAPLSFDVTVQPGQVIPYRGDLQAN